MCFAFTFTASVASPVLSATSVATTVYATPHTTIGLYYDAMDIDAIISPQGTKRNIDDLYEDVYSAPRKLAPVPTRESSDSTYRKLVCHSSRTHNSLIWPTAPYHNALDHYVKHVEIEHSSQRPLSDVYLFGVGAIVTTVAIADQVDAAVISVPLIQDAIAVPVPVAPHSPSEDMDTNLPSTPIASPSGSSASTPSSAISKSPWSGKSTTTAYSSPPTTPPFELLLRSKTSSPIRAPTKSTMSAPPETPTKRPPGLGTNMLTLVLKSAFQSLDMIGELKKMEVEIRLSRSIANAKRRTATIAKQEATKPRGISKQKPQPRVARRAPRPPPKIANRCPFEEESDDEDEVM
ncbi:hypothetical protein E4T42_01118 [Aureobasidium subglaciale]|nr:hypothetical protein E4T42_01118 [Aureobasidium subglaciale]